MHKEKNREAAAKLVMALREYAYAHKYELLEQNENKWNFHFDIPPCPACEECKEVGARFKEFFCFGEDKFKLSFLKKERSYSKDEPKRYSFNFSALKDFAGIR